MDHVRPLPGYLADRYRGWKATKFAENKSWYKHLVQDGQHPRAMLLTCCDSRVSPMELFGADPGEFFIHRNIANMVPPMTAEGPWPGTPSTVEYAVTVLGVSHLVVLGHSNCGGVHSCLEMTEGRAPDLQREDSFIGRWLGLLANRVDRLPEGDADSRQRALELEAVLLSLENLMGFAFVRDAVEADLLTLHGAWIDIASGVLLGYDPAADRFVPV